MIGINHNNHFCEEYLKGLEKEREKIQMFCRELPLCLQLVTQAIKACKQQVCSREHLEEELSESDEQIVSRKLGPIVGDFFPISPNTTSSDEDQSHSHHQNNTSNNFSNEKSSANRKSDWLKTAQLWNQHPHSPTSSGAFHPFTREKRANSTQQVTKSPPRSSAKLSEISKKEKELMGKTRRSWSQELHNSFLHALQQLGGSNVATPKQIREIMKVDGLTNDEVKSHLQKYRLHERRPNASFNSNNNQMQTPQFLVVGGMWIPPPVSFPPPEYAMVSTTVLLSEEASRTTNRVAAPPPHHHLNEKSCNGDMANYSSPDNSPPPLCKQSVWNV